MREAGRIRFAREIRDRVDGLREAVRSVKGELLGKGKQRTSLMFALLIIQQTALLMFSRPLSTRQMSATYQTITSRSSSGHEFL